MSFSELGETSKLRSISWADVANATILVGIVAPLCRGPYQTALVAPKAVATQNAGYCSWAYHADLYRPSSSLELSAPEQAHGRASDHVQGGRDKLEDELDSETSQENFAAERHRLTHILRSVMVNTFCERQYSKVLSICIRKTPVGGLTAML